MSTCQYKCESGFQDLSVPTYTESSLVYNTQTVSIFGDINWANLEVWFLLRRFLFNNSSNTGAKSKREEWNSLVTNTWSDPKFCYTTRSKDPLKKGSRQENLGTLL